LLAWDTETALIGPARLAPPLACLTYSDGERAEIVHWRDAEPHARWLLEQETATANGPFDLAVLWAQFPALRDLIWDAVTKGRVHDVLTRQKLIDIGEGCYRKVIRYVAGKPRPLFYNLSDLHARYFGAPMEKDEWRLKYGELREHPLLLWHPGALHYAKFDAVATSRVFQAQGYIQTGMKRDPSQYLHNEMAQVQAHWALHLMSCWGMATDDKQVERVIARIDAEQPEFAKTMAEGGLLGKDGKRRTKVAKQMMYLRVGDAGELTTTGFKKVVTGELTRAQALAAGYIKIDEDWCEASGEPALVAYGKYARNQLLRSKIQHFRTGPFPLQTSYEILLETGRTSSSENKLLPNSAAVQNLPQDPGMRESCIAREGCGLIASDFGTAELVSFAQVCYAKFGYSRLRDAINAGKDPHLMFAARLMRLDYELLVREYKRIPKLGDAASDAEKAFYADIKDKRNIAKVFNFGGLGGLGPESFVSFARKSYRVIKTVDEMRELKEEWLEQWPEIRQYFAWVNATINAGQKTRANKKRGERPKLVGDFQQYGSGRWRGKCRFTVGCNTMFQGLTADAAKAALFEVSRRCYTDESSPLYGCRPVCFIHDEILLEAPLFKLHEAAKELERVMVEVYQRFTPDVRITAGAHAMFRWSKKAEEAFDENGRLVPWTDGDEELGATPEEKVEVEMPMAA
jgi:hypothetical protein